MHTVMHNFKSMHYIVHYILQKGKIITHYVILCCTHIM